MKNMIVLALIMFVGSTGILAQEKAGRKDTAQHEVYYTCGMHPDVKSDEPGKCPKCGMELIRSQKEQMKADVAKVYACPIHMDVVSDKPGKCPKCGSNLTLSKKEQMKMEVMKKYTCPMHPDEISDKPGKCPKCGMDMVEKKSLDKQKVKSK